jgi:hypothetical protein
MGYSKLVIGVGFVEGQNTIINDKVIRKAKLLNHGVKTDFAGIEGIHSYVGDNGVLYITNDTDTYQNSIDISEDIPQDYSDFTQEDYNEIDSLKEDIKQAVNNADNNIPDNNGNITPNEINDIVNNPAPKYVKGTISNDDISTYYDTVFTKNNTTHSSVNGYTSSTNSNWESGNFEYQVIVYKNGNNHLMYTNRCYQKDTFESLGFTVICEDVPSYYGTNEAKATWVNNKRENLLEGYKTQNDIALPKVEIPKVEIPEDKRIPTTCCLLAMCKPTEYKLI